MSHKPLKVAVAKTSFPSVYINYATCFNDVFIPCDNWKTLFFIKIFCAQKFGANAMLLPSLK